LRGSVNEMGEIARSGSAHDVLMESFCRLINETEHSMEQPFKNRLMMSRKGKAFDDDAGCVVYSILVWRFKERSHSQPSLQNNPLQYLKRCDLNRAKPHKDPLRHLT
jgi:hypothetical protein